MAEIREIHKKKHERKFYESVNLFTHIILFDMEIDRNDEFIVNRAYIYHPDFISLLLLKIKQSIKYESKYIYLSENSFSILKLLLLSYFSNLKTGDYESKETVNIVKLLFSIGTKVYNNEIIKFKAKGLEAIKLSLLSTLQNSFISYTHSFWQSYFDSKFIESKEKTTKLKAVGISKNMLLYNFFINKDFEKSSEFIQEVLPVKSIKVKSFKNDVLAKVGRIIYKATHNGNKHIRMTKLSKSKERKISDILILIFKKGFIDFAILKQVLFLNACIHRKVKKGIIKFKLHAKQLDDKSRIRYWMEYIKLKSNKLYKIQDEPVVELSEKEKHQIHIDIQRTKIWKGEGYQYEVELLLCEFLVLYKPRIEYFQGFNYIFSFFYDHLLSKNDFFTMLDYITNHIINVS